MRTRPPPACPPSRHALTLLPRDPMSESHFPPEMATHYEAGVELPRLAEGPGQLEFVRTCEIVERFFPPPPTVVLDVGGGPGAYACWLARRGYEVHLIDAMPLHVEQAREASRRQAERPLASAAVGDAR